MTAFVLSMLLLVFTVAVALLLAYARACVLIAQDGVNPGEQGVDVENREGSECHSANRRSAS